MTKSIAIIGEGETEWFYFDSLRVAYRYPFKVAPDFPFRQVEYKIVFHRMCVNRLLTSPTHSVKPYLYFVVIISKNLKKSSAIKIIL